MRQTFEKEERLCSKRLIQQLFTIGNSFEEFPVRVVWNLTPIDSRYPVQVAFSVPKRNFRRAVQRNKIKRQMREAYRKHKYLLYEPLERSGRKMALMLIYTSRSPMSYKVMEEKIILILQRLKGEEWAN